MLRGESRFHVKNRGGEDYDLVYTTNNDVVPKSPMTMGRLIIPPFLTYDENDDSRIYMHAFDDFEEIFFEEANEYTIVLAKLILRKTGLTVWFKDERVLWFIEPENRLKIVSEFPEKKETSYLCPADFTSGYMRGRRDLDSAEFLFTNVFVLQYLTDLPLKDIKYAEASVTQISGVGGILAHYTMMNNAFRSLGFKTYLKPDSTRFGDDMLQKYFRIEMIPEDADETNTIYVVNHSVVAPTTLMLRHPADFDTSVLNPDFLTEMEEYKDAVFRGGKMLGILIRGTDYISTGQQGTRQHATVDDMLPLIREWMERDGYDGIFLATEDQDILDRMKAEFGGRIRAIAQERHSARDFKEGQTIAEREKEESSGEEYRAKLEDTTVNYFYALYLLSECESFMVSGQCNGWDIVLAFNHGKFHKTCKFRVGVSDQPLVTEREE
ncbi:MAG: hypothetical protein Q4E57_03725 [Eubacteriales bacterium]|nr:hypothetical protein [Eubacteriales bacterium]